MNEQMVYSVLTEIVRDVLMRDDVVLAAETTQADIEGWDSHKQIEILLAAEDRFGIRFVSKEIDGIHCVGDIVRLVQLKT